jgi:protein SCO1
MRMTIVRARIVFALLALSAVIGVAAGCGSSSDSKPKSTSTATVSATAVAKRLSAPAQADPVKQAPDFALRNSNGQMVRLSQFRGKAVMLTFIYSHCPDVCPLIVGNLRAAIKQMGPAASKMQVVAVSVDPTGDTPAYVNKFIAAHDMTGRMEFLLGSKRELAPVWKKYGVQVEGSPDQREVGHSAFVYGITGKGAVLALYPSNFQPKWVAHDTPLLASI